MSRKPTIDGVILESDTAVKTEKVSMIGILRQTYENMPVRIEHCLYRNGQTWPKSTKIYCWHDCHSFDTMPVPLVSRYCTERRLAVCFGVFCSPNCARAYAIEHRPVSYQQSLVHYTYILWKSFGILPEDQGGIALPRERINTFGGDIDIVEFRKSFSSPSVYRVEDITFCVQNICIVEVISDMSDTENVEDGMVASREGTKIPEIASKIIQSERHFKSKESQKVRVTESVTRKTGHTDDDDDDDDDDDVVYNNDKEEPSSGDENAVDKSMDESVLDAYTRALQFTNGDVDAACNIVIDNSTERRNVTKKKKT